MTELAEEILSGLAFGGVGLALLVIGFVAVDAILPGDIRKLIWQDRNQNAALVLSSAMLAIGAIITTAIATSADDFSEGLTNAVGYGLLGIVLLALSFVIVDWCTPGKLGVICTDTERHPAVYVTVATHIALGAILAASIS